MPGISLVGVHQAGNTILGPGNPQWTVDGAPMSLLGDAVAGHGEPPHSAPVMAEGSSWFTLNGIPVVCAGCLASCGHAANGSTWFFIQK